MKKQYFILITFFFLTACTSISYNEAMSKWTSHKDVANWMRNNFRWSQTCSWNTSESILMPRCGDCQIAANFVMETLNKINPQYNARRVYIMNSVAGANDHFATAFNFNNKLYVMDYGAGKAWEAMHGTHGPYDSLTQYEKYLRRLNIRNFKVKFVSFEGDAFPGLK